MAFAITTETAPSTDSGPVVIVRRKKIAIQGQRADHTNERDQRNDVDRSPKVYRVNADQSEESGELSAEPRVLPASEGKPSLGRDGCMVLSRRRKHRKNGGVTIIRPVPPSPSELAERTRIVTEQYERLKVEIQKLDRQIELARKVEVGKAVRWIRKAIAQYGLTAKDLGLH